MVIGVYYIECSNKHSNDVANPYVIQGTIGQYFATIHCVVCGRLSVKNVCSLCTGDPQKVAMVITNRIQSSEMSYHQLLLVSIHCVCIHLSDCVYVCLYMCVLCVCLRLCVCKCGGACVCMYVCVYTCMHACVCVCVRVCMRVYMCIHACVHVYMCIHACVHVLACVYVYACVCARHGAKYFGTYT